MVGLTAILQVTTPKGATALHTAAGTSALAEAKVLLKARSQPVNVGNLLNQYPLDVARGNVAMEELLRSHCVCIVAVAVAVAVAIAVAGSSS